MPTLTTEACGSVVNEVDFVYLSLARFKRTLCIKRTEINALRIMRII
jgi:hypothetical protein